MIAWAWIHLYGTALAPADLLDVKVMSKWKSEVGLWSSLFLPRFMKQAPVHLNENNEMNEYNPLKVSRI